MRPTYIRTKPESIVNVTRIVTVHYYEFDKSFVFGGESHDFWEMVYVDKGRILVRSGDEELVLGQGEIIFHAPDEFHSVRALDSSPNFFVISFECDSAVMQSFVKLRATLSRELRPFISSIISEAERTYVIPKNDTELCGLVKKESADLGGEQLVKTYLEQLLIMLLRSVTVKSNASFFPSKESLENHIVKSVKEYIEEHAHEVLRLEDICTKFGYGKTYLCRLFREQTGNTIGKYAIERKIHLAKAMIREREKNFSEIAEELSFDNQQYFARVFKRTTGMSPTEFKNSLRREG